ncbi:hypothetical protein [Flavobacterium sp.]|uniref:hypothetical protein n=1 Tax=Flavobacterium sp. TaxID=239 RepID=UPI00260C1068|nr:hypothetical protein [Flavobacterium sp.]
MKNWKTSLFGSLAAICGAAATVDTPYKSYFVLAATVFGAAFAFFSKDSNVTGV